MTEIRYIRVGSVRYPVEVLGPDPDAPGYVFVRYLGATRHESRVPIGWLEKERRS